MKYIIIPFYQRLLKFRPNALLVLLFSLSLTAQEVPTFEMTLPEVPGITNLQVIPGTNQFYACSQKFYEGRVAPVVMKMDTAGNMLQQREYNVPAFRIIIQSRATASGGLLVLGGHDSFDLDTVHCLLLKANGDVDWCKSYYLPGQSFSGSDILETSDGDIVISGSILRDEIQHDPFLLKLDKDGNSIWMKRFKASENRNALGGGIIQKNNAIIFCSAVEGEDFTQRSIRLSRIALSDGSFLAATELVPADIGFDLLNIYDDLNGGFYVTGRSFLYRAPVTLLFILRLSGDLELINNYQITNSSRYHGFGVLKDGFVETGCKCGGFSNPRGSSYLTKVSVDGQLLYGGHYPGFLSNPSADDTLTVIYNAVSVGNQAIVSGRKKGEGFISSLNNFKLSKNNCSLFPNNVEISGQEFITRDTQWTAILNETAVAISLSANFSIPGVTPDIATCVVSPVLYVDQNATGLNDGSSWQNAYTSFTAALDKLNTTAGIDSILVAAGTYTPAPNPAFIFSKLHAVILGGYPTGGGTRDPLSNPVILQGEVRFEQSVWFDGFKLQ